VSTSGPGPETPDETSDPVQAAAETAEQTTAARDAEYWAKSISRLSVGEIDPKAVNINVQGRRVTSPMQGFGKLWRKSYKVALTGADVEPNDVIKEWKANFGSFWPKGNYFYGPFTELSPGDVGVLNLRTGGGVKLSTGVFVLYADDEAFTFMTPEGHQFAAMITFTADKRDAVTYAQVQPLFRTSDPLFELVSPIMTRMEDKFWRRTLENLARHFGVSEPNVEVEAACLDKKRQWKMAGNVRYNSAVRSFLHTLTAPFRWIGRLVARRRGNA
jgi:hypothetical protein